MYLPVIFHLCSIIIETVTWVVVGSSPEDQFLSVRSKKCALTGRSTASSHHTRRSNKEKKAMQKKLLFEAGPVYIGPKKTPKYDPTEGYEPYWVGGDWTLDKDWVDVDATTTTVAPVTKDGTTAIDDSYCGFDCNLVYRAYGEVCGRNKNAKYKTYPNYCLLLGEDCAQREGWVIAHRGSCETTLRTYMMKVREQHKVHMDLAEKFYKRFSRPIGSGVNSTQKWTYLYTYDDNRRKK